MKSPFPKCRNSTFRENRKKLWLKITPTSFPDSLPTTFVCEGLSPLETSASEFVGIHVRQNSLAWSCDTLDQEPKFCRIDSQQKMRKFFFRCKRCVLIQNVENREDLNLGKIRVATLWKWALFCLNWCLQCARGERADERKSLHRTSWMLKMEEYRIYMISCYDLRHT